VFAQRLREREEYENAFSAAKMKLYCHALHSSDDDLHLGGNMMPPLLLPQLHSMPYLVTS
jgi:hypothetical protein